MILLIFVAAMAMAQQEGTGALKSTYLLGPDDQVVIRGMDVEELPKEPIRVDPRGNINLPLVGRLKAAGLTLEQLEEAISERLRKYLKDPQIAVSMTEMRSQPVSVLGAVSNPGVHQLQGRKTLFEMISMAGGLKQEAGYVVKITRRKEWGAIPLPSAKDDETGQFSVAEVKVSEIMNAQNPQQNIEIRPNDVITVPKGEIVYVVGAVKRSGGFVLGEKERVTALQALAMAEGADAFAATKSAKILRKTNVSATERIEIAVDLSRVLKGQISDVAMQAEDILFVPVSGGRKALARTAEAAIGIGSGIAIWRVGTGR